MFAYILCPFHSLGSLAGIMHFVKIGFVSICLLYMQMSPSCLILLPTSLYMLSIFLIAGSLYLSLGFDARKRLGHEIAIPGHGCCFGC